MEPETPAPLPFVGNSRSSQITTAIVIVITGLGLVVVLTQFDEIRLAIQRAEWNQIPGALALTFLSYLAMSLAFGLVSQALGIRMHMRDLAEIGFVSNIINHIVAAGGVAGYSIRYILMSRHGASLNDVIAASLLHFYLTSLDMIVMTPIAIGYLVLHTEIPIGITYLLTIMAIVLAIGAGVTTILIFSKNMRQPILLWIAKTTKRVTRKDFSGAFIDFNIKMSYGVGILFKQPIKLISVMALTAIDWIASIFVLRDCLDAFGSPVKIGVVITGFVIGIVAGVLSMIPGGLGVQESSMAGIFVLLGVPFEQAVLGAILFRGVFFLLPYLISLIFYRRLMNISRMAIPPSAAN